MSTTSQSQSPYTLTADEPSDVPKASPSRPAEKTTTPARTHRKPHTKARTGCATCKRRKIKCDETHPSCRNCVRRAIECDFATAGAEATIEHPLPRDPSLNLVDLELLYNFTSSTYTTLTSDQVIRDVWRSAVVRRAFNCEFVMHTILAVSGLHIAQFRPSQASFYLSKAMVHHKAASQAAVSLMAELHPQNHENLWLFSILTIYFALGSPRGPTTSLLIGDSVLPDWIFLMSGVRHLLMAMGETSYTGILSPILKTGSERWEASHQPQHLNSTILDDLLARVRQSAADKADELRIYEQAIEELRCQLSLVMSSDHQTLDIMDPFVWQFTLAEEFPPLLRQAKQEAVAIFAHSLVIFNVLNGNKWLHGWDSFLASRVWDILDDEHRLWVQWPIEEIGWVPPPSE